MGSSSPPPCILPEKNPKIHVGSVVFGDFEEPFKELPVQIQVQFSYVKKLRAANTFYHHKEKTRIFVVAMRFFRSDII